MRLDQWLWAVRLYKTRTIAAEAVMGGHVKVYGNAVKPAREMKPGDLVVASCGQMTRTLRVLGSPDNRVGAKLVPQFAQDLTPPEEFNRARDPVFVNPAFRPKGAGGPTKKERRRLDDVAL
jgi:ribosome-associated heat shock protein Hsp15